MGRVYNQLTVLTCYEDTPIEERTSLHLLMDQGEVDEQGYEIQLSVNDQAGDSTILHAGFGYREWSEELCVLVYDALEAKINQVLETEGPEELLRYTEQLQEDDIDVAFNRYEYDKCDYYKPAQLERMKKAHMESVESLIELAEYFLPETTRAFMEKYPLSIIKQWDGTDTI